MSFEASPGASALVGARFVAGVAAQCENLPTLILGVGPSCPRGLINLDLYFRVVPEPAAERSILTRLGRMIFGKEASAS